MLARSFSDGPVGRAREASDVGGKQHELKGEDESPRTFLAEAENMRRWILGANILKLFADEKTVKATMEREGVVASVGLGRGVVGGRSGN